MSPNGRRRFRKMNRRFRQRGPADVRERARKTTGGMARKMVLVRYWGRDPLPLPVKPFTARSLVGMTMGARKRKRWATVQSAGQYDAPGAARYIGGPYRIGERLRPCPGCFHCQPGVKGWHLDRSRSGRFNMPTLALHCDGSGVLPARKS